MTKQLSLDDATQTTEEMGDQAERVVISSQDLNQLYLKFDSEPERRESQFPNTDYYWSYPVTDLDSGTAYVINSSSSRLKNLVDSIRENNGGELEGVKGVLIREGSGFSVQFGWIPEDKLPKDFNE